MAGMSRSPEAHYKAVCAMFHQRESTTVSVDEAARQSLVLTADVIATTDSPTFDNSQMDGYAVPDIGGGEFTVGPTVPAGTDPDVLYPDGLTGRAAPVMTGAKLPRDSRAVVPVETCTPSEFVDEGQSVRTPATETDKFIRFSGSDIRCGDVIVAAGTPVTPVVVGALASQSIADVQVYRPARLLIISGGAEIGGTGAAQIHDANTPMIKALAEQYGIDVVGHVATNDDPDTLRGHVRRVAADTSPDVIVTSGGISHGKFEVVRQVFDNGWYGHVTQQPGGPQGLSTFDGIPVISLPGNPVSTLVSFRLYVAPILGVAPEPMRVPLGEDLTGISGKDQFVRGRIVNGRAVSVGGRSSHLLAQSATATCLIRIPSDARLSAGQEALVYPL